MGIDPREIKSIEDSMVHDIDEEPHPEGWGVYVTLRFLSRMVMAVYGLMLLLMVGVQVLLRGGPVPLLLKPASTLVGLPIVLVAVYFYLVSDAEPEIAAKRTPVGKVVTFALTFMAMQVFTMASWIGLVKAFSLH